MGDEIKFERLQHSETNKIRLSDLVKSLDNEYTPSISSMVDDIQIYIKKIIENAVIVIAKCNEKDIGFIATYCNDKRNFKTVTF